MDSPVNFVRKLVASRKGNCAYRLTARYSEQKDAPISRPRRALRQLSELQPAETWAARKPIKAKIGYILGNKVYTEVRLDGMLK